MTVIFTPLFIAVPLFLIIPWIIGFVWVLPDANRNGQPGLLWAALTIPLSWLAILVYLVVRALLHPRPGI